MNNVTDKFNDLDLSNTKSDADDLPDDLKGLIEETVKESTSKSDTSSSRKEVSGEELRQFFTAASAKLISKETLLGLSTDLTALSDEHKKNPEKRLECIRLFIEEIYSKCWVSLGIDPTLGKHAISNTAVFLSNPYIPEEFKTLLEASIETFTKAEHELVGSHLLGREEYDRRQEQKDRVTKAKNELKAEFDGLDQKQVGEKMLALKQRGGELRQRLMAMGQEKAVEYVDKPSKEDSELLLKLSALSMLMQEQAHNHSHNGVACQGHGHAEHPHDHGHSHGGQPCSGHGHAEQAPDHGHSHGGQPCSGHGHTQHGHSHGDDEQEDCHDEHEHHSKDD